MNRYTRVERGFSALHFLTIIFVCTVLIPALSSAAPIRGRILYQSIDTADVNATANVYWLDLTTGEKHFVFADADRPAWSPDGSQIAYVRRPSEDVMDVRVTNSDGTGDRLVYSVNHAFAAFNGWTPAGDRLLFNRKPDTNICAGYVYSVDLNGGDEQLLIDPLTLTGNDISVYGVCFSESGDEVYWASQIGCGSATLEVFRAGFDGTSVDPATVVQISDENGVYEDLSHGAQQGGKLVIWRSVGHAVDRNYHEIFVMDPDGSNAVRLTNDSTADYWAFASPWGDHVIWGSEASGSQGIMTADLSAPIPTVLLDTSVQEVPMGWVMDSTVPQVISIEDVPNDQGRRVRVSFTRSAHDAQFSASPIMQYEMYRRIDVVAARAVSLDARIEFAREAGMASDAEILAAGWDFVTAMPAHGEMMNYTLAGTLADSTIATGMHLSTFMVRAATTEPLIYFDSPEASGYSIDNLVPGDPGTPLLTWADGFLTLSWGKVEDDDLAGYRVYEDGVQVAGVGHATAISGSSFTRAGSAWTGYFEVSAVDRSGNESDLIAAEPSTATPALAQRLALRQNSPNPFNPSTVISFILPETGQVRLSVFDVRGRTVRTLINDRIDSGEYRATWDGTDESGRGVSSGIYFARLEYGSEVRSIRMALVK